MRELPNPPTLLTSSTPCLPSGCAEKEQKKQVGIMQCAGAQGDDGRGLVPRGRLRSSDVTSPEASDRQARNDTLLREGVG